MNTNTENLSNALIYWMHASKPHSELGLYVVAMTDGERVYIHDTTMMVSGCCKPHLFTTREEADKMASEMEFWMQEVGTVTVMTFDDFCSLQAGRCNDAIRMARIADAMARELVAA